MGLIHLLKHTRVNNGSFVSYPGVGAQNNAWREDSVSHGLISGCNVAELKNDLLGVSLIKLISWERLLLTPPTPQWWRIVALMHNQAVFQT